MFNLNKLPDKIYRSDIDGLRAIAVLAVILFHLDIPGFPSGYLGVDIFFVISGYLITSIILKDINNGEFSIAGFYERRIRRIFPALYPVIFFTVIIACYLFDTNALKDFGKSIIATSLFISNILFFSEVGYFALPALKKPLLHTWSLSVEEQFYIFLPLILLFINKYWNKRYFSFLLILAILSFSINIYGVCGSTNHSFYFFHSRAWELLVGSILALGVLQKPTILFVRNILSISGIILIVYSVSATSFSVYSQIASVIGAALIIYSGIGGISLINNVISTPPFVYIGLISYSLYLWHWPLIAFCRYIIFRPFNIFENLFIIIFSILIATISWRFIEQPFRQKKLILIPNNRLIIFTFILIISTSVIGAIITFINTDYIWHRSGQWEKYITSKISEGVIPPVVGNNKLKPTFILLGDSHAMALIPMIENQALHHRLSGYIVTQSGWAPLLNVYKNQESKFDLSQSFLFQKGVAEFINSHKQITTVILSSRWAWHATGFENRLEDPTKRYIINKNIPTENNSSILKIARFKNSLFKTVDILLSMQRKVIIVSDVPEIRYDVPHFYMLTSRFPMFYEKYDIRPTINEYNDREKNVKEMLSELSKLPNVTVIYPESKLFDINGKAIIINNGDLLYRDDNHLSTFGAYFLSPLFDDLFIQIAKTPKTI